MFEMCAGFSLRVLVLARTNPRRLKSALLEDEFEEKCSGDWVFLVRRNFAETESPVQAMRRLHGRKGVENHPLVAN